MVAYFSMIAPVVIFHASASLRDSVRRATGLTAPAIDAHAFVRALQDFVLRSLVVEAPRPPSRSRARRMHQDS
jgi:hypothetical protein